MTLIEIIGAAGLTYLFGISTAVLAMRLKPRRKRKKATVVAKTPQRKKKPVRKVATDPFPLPPLPTLPPMRKVK